MAKRRRRASHEKMPPAAAVARAKVASRRRSAPAKALRKGAPLAGAKGRANVAARADAGSANGRGKVVSRRARAAERYALRAAQKLIVIGSSAGGIEALTKVLRNVPSSLNAAIIVAQHLGALRPSFLPTILQSPLEVVSAENGARLKPGVVHVCPPDRDVEVKGEFISLVEPAEGRRAHPSIDLLFESAARSWGDRVLGVILSGSGHDGAAGLRAIKALGGTTLTLTIETATFADMSRAAQLASPIDFVVPLDEVGAKIGQFCDDTLAPSDGHLDVETIEPVLERLRRLTNRDFRHYKRGTVTRRIRHRMLSAGARRIEDYVKLLDADPTEHQKLLEDLQIGVTSFFRDPAAWRVLGKALRSRLFRGDGSAPIRVWCAGCATGEEAYSIALLLGKLIGTHERDVKIYATDTDTQALEIARRGVYSAQSVGRVPRYLRGGLEPLNGDYRIARDIRKWVIFGPHDVTKNPPIFNLDLLICRNVLIYFNPALQSRVLQILRYALKANGLLFLGKSEVPIEKDDFDVVDARWRIYSLPSHRPRTALPPRGPQLSLEGRMLPLESDEAQIRNAMDISTRDIEHLRIYDELLLNALPSAIVAVDPSYRVQTWSTAAERIFQRSAEEVLKKDFFHSVPGLPYRELKTALDQVLRGSKRRIDGLGLELTREPGPPRRLRGVIVKLSMANARSVVVMIFDDITEPAHLAEELAQANNRLDAALREVQQKNELLQTTNEEMETANEELQATNEELETANEEHQATNEELETTIEEHQATNEELQATNEELETTNDELHRRTTALQAMTQMFDDMLQSLAVGAFALGVDRTIHHANKLGLELLGIRKNYRDTPFDALKLGWKFPDLSETLDKVDSDEKVLQFRDVPARKERTLDVTFAPLRDHEGAFAGYIVSLIDRTRDGGSRENGKNGKPA